MLVKGTRLCSWGFIENRYKLMRIHTYICISYIYIYNIVAGNKFVEAQWPFVQPLTHWGLSKMATISLYDIFMHCLKWIASYFPFKWRHNRRDGVLNYQPHHCLLNRLFRRRSKKTSKFRVTGLCAVNSPGTGEFPHKWPVTRKMFPFDDVIMLQASLRCLMQCKTLEKYWQVWHTCYFWALRSSKMFTGSVFQLKIVTKVRLI